MLIQVSQERQLSHGRVAQLKDELALQKKYSSELKSSQDGKWTITLQVNFLFRVGFVLSSTFVDLTTHILHRNVLLIIIITCGLLQSWTISSFSWIRRWKACRAPSRFSGKQLKEDSPAACPGTMLCCQFYKPQATQDMLITKILGGGWWTAQAT